MSCKKDKTLAPISIIEQWQIFGNNNDTVRDLVNTTHFIWAATQNNGLIKLDKKTNKNVLIKKPK